MAFGALIGAGGGSGGYTGGAATAMGESGDTRTEIGDNFGIGTSANSDNTLKIAIIAGVVVLGFAGIMLIRGR